MFDYFKKHKMAIDKDFSAPSVNTDVEAVAPKAAHDVPQLRATGYKPKRDKVFIVILIVLAVVLVVGFVTGTGNTADSAEIENNFKFSFNISDGIMLGVVIVGYIIMRIRKGRNS